MHVMSPFYPQICFFLRISPQTPPLPMLHTDRLLTATAWYQVKATAPHQLKTGHALLLLVPYSLHHYLNQLVLHYCAYRKVTSSPHTD